MPLPVADRYPLVAGRPTYGGKVNPGVLPTAALMGDSLTSLGYGPLHPYGWSLGPLKTVANCGVAGDYLHMMLARIDNHYTAAQPGFAGLGDLGWGILRGGTNNFRGGGLINSTTQGLYIALLDKILSYARKALVFAVPPVFADGNSAGAGPNSANAWLAGYCAGHPDLTFIDDCTLVRTAGGNWVNIGMAPDDIHMSDWGSCMMGLDGGPKVQAALAPYGYASPLVTDAADKYPSTDNWVQNSTMAGTGGSNGIGTGLVPTGWQVSRNGAGNSANTSIVPADGGDPNATPWLRVTPTALGASSSWITLRADLLLPAITLLYPDALDVCVEVRFNDLDAIRFQSMSHFVYGNAVENLSPPSYLRLAAPETINRRVVWRTAVRRSGTRKDTHASVYIDWRLRSAGAYSGAMGSFDVRCLSIRAS